MTSYQFSFTPLEVAVIRMALGNLIVNTENMLREKAEKFEPLTLKDWDSLQEMTDQASSALDKINSQLSPV